MQTMNSDREELERYAQVLSDQAQRLVSELNVDVSDAERFLRYSPALRQAADAYQRLDSARRKTDAVTWERTMVDGRNGDEIMGRLWEVREELLRQDESAARQKR